jgi:hypothetical protein
VKNASTQRTCLKGEDTGKMTCKWTLHGATTKGCEGYIAHQSIS